LRVLLAFDKFRDSMSAFEVIQAIKSGLLNRKNGLEIEGVELADGGEGSLEIFAKAYDCKLIEVETKDALGKDAKSKIGINLPNSTAVIEMAQHCGIAKVPLAKRNPMKTSSFGLGEAIKHAISFGAKKIILGIGGSATNDGGAGMLYALGYDFLDKEGNSLFPLGGNLYKVSKIIPPNKETKADIIIASDVMNPIIGPNGATYAFGIQKGGTEDTLPILENNIKHYARLVSKMTQSNVEKTDGYGAAGGVPLSACEFLHAKIISGSQLVYQTLGLKSKIDKSDLIITGEGKIDNQTSNGKAISPIIDYAIKMKKKIILVCGIYKPFKSQIFNELTKYQLTAVASELHLDSFEDAQKVSYEVGKRIAKDLI